MSKKLLHFGVAFGAIASLATGGLLAYKHQAGCYASKQAASVPAISMQTPSVVTPTSAKGTRNAPREKGVLAEVPSAVTSTPQVPGTAQIAAAPSAPAKVPALVASQLVSTVVPQQSAKLAVAQYVPLPAQASQSAAPMPSAQMPSVPHVIVQSQQPTTEKVVVSGRRPMAYANVDIDTVGRGNSLTIQLPRRNK